jgi:hypothetical protein
MNRYALLILTILCWVSTGNAQTTGARYLIITHDAYYEAIQPLAQWKTQKGMNAKVVRLSDIGNDTTQIKAYITDAYMNWGIRPEYVLFVGNKYQVPFPRIQVGYEAVYTDNYYTDVTGDGFNDMLPGRIWAYDVDDVNIAVSKIIHYEKIPYIEDSTWFSKGVTIVNEDEQGQPPSDSLYWEDARYMHGFMLNAGYTHIDSFSFVYGHDSTDVVNAINDGRTYILYRGLGFNQWLAPFDNIHSEQFANGYKMPIVLSATCATVEGIGQEWLNAGTPESPQGIVGFIGTTTSLYEAAEMRSALARGTVERIFTDSMCTLGKAAEQGRMRYYIEFGDMLEYHSWNCLGDPDMQVRTTTPRAIDVLHDSILFTGTCTLQVAVTYNSIPVRRALVCAMSLKDSLYYHRTYTNSNGIAEFIDQLSIPGDSIIITVTGRNVLTYQSIIRVGMPGYPYVLLNSFSLSDTTGGNADTIANPGEDIEVPVWLKNWGAVAALDVTGILQHTQLDTCCTLTDTSKYFGFIAPLDSAFSTFDGYNVSIAPWCPDLHAVELQLKVTDINDSIWTSYFGFTVHAPIITLHNAYFAGFLKYTDPGDTAELFIQLSNDGTYKAEDTHVSIMSLDTLFSIIDSLSYFGTVLPGDTIDNQSDPFVITTSSDVPTCHPVDIAAIITAGLYIDTITLTLYIGQKDFLVWDPDLNHSSGPIIKSLLDSCTYYGDYLAVYPDGLLSIYKSIFICCGMFPYNFVIRDTSRAAQEIVFYADQQDGKVYLEGGDVWVADPQSNYGYNFCSLFGILPISNSIGSFPGVYGCDNTFTRNMLFDYTGEAILIDRLDTIPGSVHIHKNTHNGYCCGVARNNTSVGQSFELAGLTDGTAPSTRRTLVDSIMRYFNISASGLEEVSSPEIKEAFMSIHPNPSHAHVQFAFYTGVFDNNTRIIVYDVAGRRVITIHTQPAHEHTMQAIWDGRDDMGRLMPQGIYFARLMCNDDMLDTRKFIIVR